MMTHYRMGDKYPSAILTVNGNELKIYPGNQVFLNTGDQFEFRFFNPLSEKIGIEISLNGQKRGGGLLVLNPGQDVSLDRFLDDSRKMRFETYTIDGNNADAVAAAALNGLVEFRFFKEQVNYNWNTRGYSTLGNCNGMGTTLYGSSSVGCCFTSSVDFSGNLKSLKKKSRSAKGLEAVSMDSLQDFNEEETGRVEKGDASAQNLQTVDTTFQPGAFYTIQYQIKPHSAKPVQMQEIRNYCPHCKYRIRKDSWKFCPKCGGDLS